VKLRIPAWCAGARVAVNGKPSGVAAPAGRYAAVAGEWKDGDKVQMELPLSLRVVQDGSSNPGKAALAYGPLVLATDEVIAGQKLPGPRDGGPGIVLASTDPRELALKTLPVGNRPTWTNGQRFYEITAHRGTADKVGESFRLRLLPFAEVGSYPWSREGAHPRLAVWFDAAVSKHKESE